MKFRRQGERPTIQAPNQNGADTDKDISHNGKVSLAERGLIGVGSFSAFFGFAGVSILAYPVYNMMFGVNAALVGLALMIPRLWDAVTDPIMGRISDNANTRWGRRKPFIVAGAFAMAILFGCIWMVPADWSDTWKITYLIGFQILFFTAYTVFAVPYTALTYEMTPDYRERTVVMSFCAFFHKAGEFLGGWMLPLAALFSVSLLTGASDPERSGIIVMGWCIGILILGVCGSLPGLFVKERFVREKVDRDKPVALFASIRDAMRNRAFLILVVIIVLNTLSGVLAMGIDQYLLVYFMHDGDKALGLVQKGVLTSGYAVVGFLSIPVINWLASKFDKKGALYLVYGLMVIGSLAKWFVFAPGHPMIHVGGTMISPILLIDPLLCGPMWVAVKIMLASMMADICDEDEYRHGQRREGMFGAVFSWLEKMIVSLAYMSTGIALAVAAFDPDLGGEQAPETFTIMRLFLAGAPAITALFALVALYFYPINEKRAGQTRRKLEERRGATGAGN